SLQDAASTRIPRLDGISRIPPPGSFIGGGGGTTSHIRPPTFSVGVPKSTTQIFRAPALPPAAAAVGAAAAAGNKKRPISSYHPAMLPRYDIEAQLKKSASGEQLSHELRVKRSNKKYMAQSKCISGAAAVAGAVEVAAAGVAGGARARGSQRMACSMPQTPMPAAKQQQQELLTSSTPMPLLRSETFVWNEQVEQVEQVEQQQRNKLESTRLSSVGCELDATCVQFSTPHSRTGTPRTRTVILSSAGMGDVTTVQCSNSINRTRPVIKEKELEQELAGQRERELEADQNLTRILDAAASTCSFGLDRTRPIIMNASQAREQQLSQTLDVTKSMDQLPLLEHMSIPADLEELEAALDVTLTELAPDRSNMKLPLNSTLKPQTQRLLDITALQSPARHIQLLNLTQEMLQQVTPPQLASAGLGRRSLAQHALVCLTPTFATSRYQQTPQPVHLLSPLLKAARSDLVLPTRTPDAELPPPPPATLLTPRTRYSFGLDLTEPMWDSSIELVDNSCSGTQLKKQHSFEMDESLGILTPDQMKEFLDSSSQQLQQQQQQQQHLQQQRLLQLRLEQTPSPEELPLDPIEPQLVAAATAAAAAVPAAPPAAAPAVTSSAKLSNSFITSVTSVTSLDTGYQGDGEMSRPASRGACDHSPSNGPQLGRVSRQPSFPPMPAQAPPMRRQDPMTDSDFFTESDADDVLQRGDRRAQVIDGQLYGPAMLQPSASVPQLEDSCMESSGIFTDVENRCDEEMRLPELEVDVDMELAAAPAELQGEGEVELELDLSPDESNTQTMRKAQGQSRERELREREHAQLREHAVQQQQRPLSSSTTLSLSNRTSYCSVDGGSAKSFCDEAFSSSSGAEQQQRSTTLSVQRAASPRTHASSSLTSLCTVESTSLAASPKSCKPAARARATPPTPPTPPTTTTATAKAARKTHTPNKWDAVMHKIASNKSTIKTNYSDVKSKVSTTRPMAAMAGAGAAARSNSSSPSTSSSSPRISPPARRSPSVTSGRGATVKRATTLTLNSTSASTSTRQPQDKGSVGVGVGVSVFARLSKSPTTPNGNGGGGGVTAAACVSAVTAKRLQSAQSNRGRAYNEDSQKSSHSDLSSLCNGNASGGGSPKLLAKTPMRAAKKRDVRNLSISPTDLGPPPKTQQTAKGQSAHKSITPTSTVIQKRLNNTNSPGHSKVAGKAATQQIQQNKQQQQQQIGKNNVVAIKNCTKHLPENVSEESLRSGVDQTELQELNELGLISSLTSSAPAPRDSKRASISHELACICGTTELGGSTACSCGAAEKAPKLKRQERKEQAQDSSIEQQPELIAQIVEQEHEEVAEPKEADITIISSTKEDLHIEPINTKGIVTVAHSQHEEIAEQIPSLKCYLENGYFNVERLREFLEVRGQQQEEEQCQLMGLAIVVQFMSKQHEKLETNYCVRTSCSSSSSSSSCSSCAQMEKLSCEKRTASLSEELAETRAQLQQEQELRKQQDHQLQQAHDKLQEMQMRFRDFESQLLAKDEEKRQALQSYHQEVAHQLRHKQDKLAVAEQQVLQLQQRIGEQEQLEQQLRDKLTRKEHSQTLQLAEAARRLEEAQAGVKALTKELQTLRDSTEHKERDLRDRLALTQDEIAVLRSSSSSGSGSGTGAQRRSSPSSNGSNNDSGAELSRLTSEADSLRCVLELKQAEISTLSKQNAELQREIEEQRSLSNRLTLLEAKNEMLRIDLESKTEKEKETQRQMEELQKAFNHETLKRKRLTCDKEELQYHLKQRSQQLSFVQAQLQDRLANSSASNLNSTLDHSRSSLHSNSISTAALMPTEASEASMCSMSSTTSSATCCSSAASPPASPVIKGIIERQDSVSWVLEIEGDTSAATRLVRRAASLRSERSPTQRRQSANTSCSSATNGQANGHVQRPNPLSQSASATLLMRTQSHEPESPRRLCRARSQSVCTNTNSNSNANTHTHTEPIWHAHELRASSPHPLPPPPAAVELRAARCSKQLMSGDMASYPKAMHKKFQEIQESAGEAMVSGANSEDESCSGSSEDMMHSSSASSSASAETAGGACTHTKRLRQPSRRTSIEEALQLEQQANSLNGTPMEVSWSEDAADADA
ncbi:hypothetical protein KR222_003559, partial [Zaprionus bogoriensis]